MRGYTVTGLAKRQDRLVNIDRGLHRLYESLHRMVEKRFMAFEEAIAQAIADRYATIRNAQEEISELKTL